MAKAKKIAKAIFATLGGAKMVNTIFLAKAKKYEKLRVAERAREAAKKLPPMKRKEAIKSGTERLAERIISEKSEKPIKSVSKAAYKNIKCKN